MKYDITFKYEAYEDSETLGTATFFYGKALIHTEVDFTFSDSQQLSDAFKRAALIAGEEQINNAIRLLEQL